MLQNNQHCFHFQGEIDEYYIESLLPQQASTGKCVKTWRCWACLFDISGIWCLTRKMWTIWSDINLIWPLWVVLLLSQHPRWGEGRLGQNMYLGIWPLSFTNSFIERLKWRGNISDRSGDKKRCFCKKNQIVRICLKSSQREFIEEGTRRKLLPRISDWLCVNGWTRSPMSWLEKDKLGKRS